MILIKYILKKVFKNQLIILILLFLVCICQKLIKILGSENNVPIYSIFLYLSLGIPELSKLIIPFSLFLSVIITCHQLHLHNEILAMYSCGINKYTLIQSIFLCSLIVSLIAFINLSWLCPYCEQYQNHILTEIQKHTRFNTCMNKKFQFFVNKNLILFVETVNNEKLKNIFIVGKKKDNHTNMINIITADQGNIYHDYNNSQSIILNSGTYYVLHNNQHIYTNICITKFSKHQLLIDCNLKYPKKNRKTINHMFIHQLWYSSLLESNIELHWRLTLLVSTFLMPILALVLIINISHQYILNFVLSMILYIIFFLSHILLRFYHLPSEIHSVTWIIWLINFIYFIMIYLINLKKNYL